MSRISSLLKVLGERPISIHPIYLRITNGCVTAAYLLSQIIYWDGVCHGEEFYKTDQEFSSELCVGNKQFRAAKSLLKNLGIISTILRGVPAKTFYKINLETLEDLLEKAAHDTSEKRKTSLPKTGKLDCLKQANCVAQNRQTTTETTTEIKNTYNAQTRLSDPVIENLACQEEAHSESGLDKKKPVPKPPSRQQRTLHSALIAKKHDDAFCQWYALYPRKVARAKALRIFPRALTTIAFEKLLELTKAYARTVEEKDKQFIPHPATWLNDQRWNDLESPPQGLSSEAVTPEEIITDWHSEYDKRFKFALFDKIKAADYSSWIIVNKAYAVVEEGIPRIKAQSDWAVDQINKRFAQERDQAFREALYAA